MKRVLAVLALVLAAGAAHAQVDRATITGTVSDESGGALTTASISVTNTETKVVTRVKTTDDGAYLVVNLIPGQYVVEAEAAGFANKADAVILEIGQRARVDFSLAVGTMSEAVTVEAARRLLNTEQSAVGTVLDQNAVAKLPLAIRNWDDLLALVAGVQGDRYSEEGGATALGRTGGVNVHGNRSLQNNFLLDGVDNNSISTNVQELSAQVSRPSIDSIQEFKVVTSPYSAEYGRSPGAAISVTTKSGTNQFHGGLYDYYRDERFDSNSYFNEDFRTERNLDPLAKPKNDQNQYGAHLGGPIVKDKAFFFADFEGTRITRGVTRITRVPTADERNGIFVGGGARPAHRPALPEQHHPPRPLRPRVGRPSSTCCRRRTRRGRTTTPARTPPSPTTPTASSAAWTCACPSQGQRLRALHLHDPRPRAARLVRRGRRRHVELRARRPGHEVARPRAAAGRASSAHRW